MKKRTRESATEPSTTIDTPLAVSPPGESAVARWFKRLGFMALGAAGSYLMLSAAAAFPLSTMLVKPRKKRLAQLESRHLRHFWRRKGIACREVAFDSFDGTRLSGWFLPNGYWSPTVIALHGVTGNRTSMTRFATALHDAGFNVFLYDARAHGVSQGDFVTYGWHETRDVQCVIDYLIREHRVPEHSIGLMGMSMGAAIALQVAAREPRVRAVWAESPFASLERISVEYIADATRLPQAVLKLPAWSAAAVAGRRGNFPVAEVSPVTIAPEIGCPVQLVHGAADDFVRPEHSRHIFEAFTTPEKDLWIVPDAGHTQCWRKARVEYRARLTDFFRTHLAPSCPWPLVTQSRH